MRSIVALLSLLLAAAALDARAASPADEAAIDTAQAGVILPRVIGPLQYIGERQFDDPRLGRAYSYRAEGFSLDIYIYQGSIGGADDGIAGIGMRNEYEAAKATVLATEAYATRKLIAERQARLGPSESAPEALEAAFDLELRGQRLRSFLWVTAANGYYFKARFSMHGDLEIEAEPAREQILNEMGNAIASARERSSPSEARASTTGQYQIHFDSSVAQEQMPFWLLYLLARVSWEQQQGTTAESAIGARVPTFDEEVFARGKAVSAFDETLDRKERRHVATQFPYFGELKRIIDAGYLREYVWLELRQQSWTEPPAGLREAEYRAWRAQHMPHHVPVTHGTLRLSTAAH